jgi:hypothetical protein
MRAVLVTEFVLGVLIAAFSLYQNEMMLFGFGCGVIGAVVGAWLAGAFIQHS